MVNLQDRTFEIISPVEIDKACEDIRLLLSQLSWVSHPYHIAQRFLYKGEAKTFYYPEIYLKDAASKNYNYHRLTPDNDYKGMFFFMVGAARPNFEAGLYNNISYPVSIIFSANMELIDKARLRQEYLFTQELIKSVRRLLTANVVNYDFDYTIVGETRDLKEVYREFTLDDLQQYNRAPLQCFRVDLQLTLQEEC